MLFWLQSYGLPQVSCRHKKRRWIVDGVSDKILFTASTLTNNLNALPREKVQRYKIIGCLEYKGNNGMLLYEFSEFRYVLKERFYEHPLPGRGTIKIMLQEVVPVEKEGWTILFFFFYFC